MKLPPIFTKFFFLMLALAFLASACAPTSTPIPPLPQPLPATIGPGLPVSGAPTQLPALPGDKILVSKLARHPEPQRAGR